MNKYGVGMNFTTYHQVLVTAKNEDEALEKGTEDILLNPYLSEYNSEGSSPNIIEHVNDEERKANV